MTVELGMPTLLACSGVDDCAALCGRLGLSFIELNMNLPMYQPGRIDEAAIARARDERGIYCTLHLDEHFNACDFNPYVREAYLHTATAALSLARRHGMPVVNLHLHEGVHFKLPDGKHFLYAQYEAEYRAGLLALREACEAAIGGAQVRVCVENTDGFAPWAQAGIDLLLQSEVFGLTLDIGHSHNAGDVDRPFYEARMDKLWHMHLHDANDLTCHLPIGQGALDIPAWLHLAGARGIRAVVEVKSPQGLAASMEVLHAML